VGCSPTDLHSSEARLQTPSPGSSHPSPMTLSPAHAASHLVWPHQRRWRPARVGVIGSRASRSAMRLALPHRASGRAPSPGVHRHAGSASWSPNVSVRALGAETNNTLTLRHRQPAAFDLLAAKFLLSPRGNPSCSGGPRDLDGRTTNRPSTLRIAPSRRRATSTASEPVGRTRDRRDISDDGRSV
jgi:hypothetical protein